MNPFLRDCGLIWRYGIHLPPSTPTVGWKSLGIATALIATLYLWLAKAPMMEKQFNAISAALVVLVNFCWLRFLRGALIYNSPTSAKLVPRIRKHAFWASLFTWIGTIVFTCLFVSSFLHGPTTDVFETLFFTALVHLAMSAAFSYTMVAWVIGMWFIFCLNFLTRLIAPPWLIPVYFLLIAVIAYYLFKFMFRIAPPKSNPAISPAALPGSLVMTSALYNKILKRDCTANRNKANLAAHILGPQYHWSRWPAHLYAWLAMFRHHPFIAAILLFNPIALYVYYQAYQMVSRLALPITPQTEANFGTVAWVVISPLLVIYVSTLEGYGKHMQAIQAEKNLFCLSAYPAKYNLNQQLARNIISAALVEWVFVTTGMLLLATLLGTPARLLLHLFFLCSICLPFIATISLSNDAAGKTLTGQSKSTPAFIYCAMIVNFLAYCAIPFEHSTIAACTILPIEQWLHEFTWVNIRLTLKCSLINVGLAAIFIFVQYGEMTKAHPARPARRLPH